MNKLLTKIVGATLGLTMAVGVGVAVGTNGKKAVQANAATSSVTLSSGTFSTDHITWTLDSAVTITQTKGNSSTAVNSSYVSAPRVYKGHILSFEAASGYVINSITITCVGTYYGNSMTAGVSVSDNTVTDDTTKVARTWTTTSGGSHEVSSVSSDGLSAIYIQNVASAENTQLRFTALSITYSSNGGGGDDDDGTYYTDEISYETLELPTNGSYGAFTGKSAVNAGHSDAVYVGAGARNGNGGTTAYSLQLNSGTGPTGIYRGVASSATGGYIRKVSVDWGKGTANADNRFLTILGSNNAYSNSVQYSGTTIGTLTFTTGSTSATMSRYTTANYKYVAIVASGAIYIDKIYVEWEDNSSAASVTNVSVSGDMSTKSYSAVDSWNNTGLSANVTMSDASTYDGSVNWSYNPASPAAYLLAQGDEITNGSVTVTASAEEQSGSKTVTGISVSYATVAQALTVIPNAGDSLANSIVKGIVVSATVDTNYGNATYFISDDGTSTNELQVYRGKYLDNASFTNTNQLQIGDNVVVYGTLKNYSGTKEFDTGSYLLSLDRPASSEPTITIDQAAFTICVGDADVTLTATTENIPDGGSVKWYSSEEGVATIGESTGAVHAVAVGSTTITAKIVNSSGTAVATNSISVSVVESVLNDGDTFIIKADYDSETYYLTGVTNNIGTTSTTKSEAMIFTVIEGETSGQFQFKNGDNYLSYSGSNNQVQTTTDGEATSTLWTAINNGTSDVIESVNVPGRKLQFNYNSGNPRFACYATSQGAPEIEKVAAPEVDDIVILGDATADAEGAFSVTSTFLYEVMYVDPENPGNQRVTVDVSPSEGVTYTTPEDGSFDVTFTANGTYTVTITSVEDENFSDSSTIVVSNIYEAEVTDYCLYTGTTVNGSAVLTEGDYIIYYDGKALKNSISSNRAEYSEVTPDDEVISTDAVNIVWHIAPAGEYYTIYNAAEEKYLASTSSNNQAKLESSLTDNSRWTVEISDGKFEFINKARDDASSNNKYLRNNGTYGFACYQTGTGGALSLYKKAYTATEYATIFTNYLGNVCDQINGNTNITDLTNTWAILSAEYALLASDVKAELVNSSSSASVLSALSSYDYIVGKYNVAQSVSAINDFMNRNPAAVGASSKTIFSIANDSAVESVAIVAIISLTTLTAVGGYFFLRKRKEEK